MTGALEEQKFLVKVRQEKPTDYLAQTSRKEVAKGEINVIIGMFPNVQYSKLQVNADSETGIHINTQQNVLMKRKILHRFQFAFRRMMDRCNYGKISRMTRPNTE